MFTSHFKSLFGGSKPAYCSTPEEDAKELEKVMMQETGGAMPDQEEMQEIMARVKGAGKK